MSNPSILTVLGLEVHEAATDGLQAIYGKPPGGPFTTFWRFDTTDPLCRPRRVTWNGTAWVWDGTTYEATMQNVQPGSHAHAAADVTGTAVLTADARLSDARTPTAHTHAASEVTGTAVVTNDARLSDARAPTAHSHPTSDVTGLDAALTAKAPLASPTFTGTVTLPASTSLTTPVVGAATGTSLAVTGLLKSSGTAGIGYATGAGGTVTQATSKVTGVTLNKTCGQITMNGAALAAAAEVSFVVTNSTVAATDVVVVCVQSVGTAGAYFVTVGAVSAGSFAITVGNCSAGSLSQAVVLNFVVIKAVAA